MYVLVNALVPNADHPLLFQYVLLIMYISNVQLCTEKQLHRKHKSSVRLCGFLYDASDYLWCKTHTYPGYVHVVT